MFFINIMITISLIKPNFKHISFKNSSYNCAINTEPDTFEKSEKKKNTIAPEVFFINMMKYDKDYIWANKMVDLTKKISDMIKNDNDFDLILSEIEKGVKDANFESTYANVYCKKMELPRRLFFLRGNGQRGHEYFKKYEDKLGRFFDKDYDYIYIPKPLPEYNEASICNITRYTDDYYDEHFCITQENLKMQDKNLGLAKKEYEKLKSIKNPTLSDINRSCAIIQWLIAQENPYIRGNDSIANVLTKSIYNAYNINISPLKKGVSLDFEAFYSDMDEYINNYPDFFEKAPSF